MRYRLSFILPVLVASALGQATISLDQIDTFQDGTTMSWAGGSSPVNIASGGPNGAGDRYLQITSTGGNMATFNLTRWDGDYQLIGVDRVEADLRNTGATPLTIRLVLFSASGDRWSSNSAVTLPAGSNWVHVGFNLAESNFTRTLGSGTWASAISGIERAMFRHEPTISANGSPVVGQLGLDNISAFAQVTEAGPSAFTVLSGIPVGGGLAELLASDNQYRIVRQNPIRARQDPAVAADFSAQAPRGSFSTIEFRLEAGTNAIPAAGVTQRIELFNFVTNTFVVVDTRPASGPDTVATATLPGNPNDFIGSGRMFHGRVFYFDPGTLLTRTWVVNFDWIQWKLIR